VVSDFNPRPLKKPFTTNQCWTFFLDAGGLRDIEVEAVTKMLAYGPRITGVKEYGCDNSDCRHGKYITNANPSCGKRPLTCGLKCNSTACRTATGYTSSSPFPIHCGLCLRLNYLCRLAVDNLLYAAGKRGLDIGIFCAIHAYGRRLNWHPHVHVSVTCGGIDAPRKRKKISFRKDAIRARWMWNIARCC
jgi:hypothetical protein